ncbi:hypothetical protein [Paenibacillus macerans]|uniref:hypothetical protein n=1 Tax=Paenibacillus macerans TaxID=44252 RepID=UPI003D31CF18
MERVIVVSLPEWVTWLQQHDHSALAAFLTLATFLGLYQASRRKSAREERSRLDYVKSSLELYAAATGPLMSALDKPPLTAAEKSELLGKLLACRAAPYATEHALAQITAFAADGDETRLSLLLRTIERESESLIAERDKLLRQIERPGWGRWLWRTIRHALPALFAAGFFVTLIWLWRLLEDSIAGGTGTGGSWELALAWMQLVSTWFSLLLLYPVAAGGTYKHADTAPARLLAAAIAMLAVVHFAGSLFAPYVLGAQVLLFLAGFRLNGRKPRKARPYVGHAQTPLPPGEAVSGTAQGRSEESETSP